MKYYYIRYTVSGYIPNSRAECSCVSNQHPFEWLKFYKGPNGTWNIDYWKEISKEEYEMGKEIIYGRK